MSQPSQPLSGTLTSLSQTNSEKLLEISYFKRILENSGFKLCSQENPNVVSQEQALVLRDLDKELNEDHDTQTVKKFLNGLKYLCRKEKYFIKALMPTFLRKNDVNESSQESLFRILLKIDKLQNGIIEILLDEITSNASEDGQNNNLHLLLQQLRYLPQIKQPEYVSTKLLDIMEIATLGAQLEILDAIPDIIPDSEYQQTAKELSKLLLENEELSSAIIDCLNALNLSADIRTEVQEHILEKLLSGTSIKSFPVLLDFLMTDYKSQNLPQIFLKIRSALDSIIGSPHGLNKEKESGKIVIFNRLQILATSKVVAETLISVINSIKVHTEHKPIDLLLLFMLHNSATLKKRPIEMLFRKKIKEGLFKCTLLEQLFEKYLLQQLAKDYFMSMVEIGSSLLRGSNEPIIAEFASTLFKLIFNHKYTEVHNRQELIDNLILLTNINVQKNVTVILNIFIDLLDDIAKIKHHTVLFMRLLEKIDSFELKDVKLVFEILSALTCSDDSLSGFKDEIHMIIRKQLSSSKRATKHRGIVSAVVLAKHIALTSEDQGEDSFTSESILTVSDLKGDAREAAALLELTNTSVSGCRELLGLYYDQLASILVKTENLDKYFMTWLYETITSNFQSTFVVDKPCESIADLTFHIKYDINASDELESPIAINIGELTIKETEKILILAPHFRLLRLLHFRLQNGDLRTINALLGCGVVLPNYDDLESMDSEQMKHIADCLFHCINWFREIISGFVTQKFKHMRSKVVKRLEHLIELENVLKNCVERTPYHRLPVSYFDICSQFSKQPSSPKKDKKVKQPRKKLKTAVEESTVMESQASTSKTKISKKMAEASCIEFREMDTDIMILFKYPLVFESDSQSTTEPIFLNLTQINFILKDFVSKLDLLTTGKNLGLSHLTVVVPQNLINDCIVILPNINKHLETVVGKIKTLLTESDGIHDSASMFTEEARQLKTTFGLILQSFSLIFNWSGFQHSKRLDLLREILKVVRPLSSSQDLNSVNRLVAELAERLSGYHDQCLELSQAVNLVKTMESLYSHTPTPEIRKKIATAAGKLLSRRWYKSEGVVETGKTTSGNLEILIKSYLSNANVKTISGLVATLQDQAPGLKSKDDHLTMLPSVDKANFYILYRNLWNSLQERIKIELKSLTNNEHLVLWRNVALTMQSLMTAAKSQPTKSNLTTFLKKCVSILKIFLSHGIPILEIMLRSKPDKVVEIFKTIQTNTRFLHHLCCQSKLTKDGGLIAHVPQFRLTLETLVYRVKAVLVANGCSAAFWMGNLRNRDLQGEDISSQNSTASEVSEQEMNMEDGDGAEELPEDDESDEDIFNNEQNDDGKSGSEYYE